MVITFIFKTYVKWASKWGDSGVGGEHVPKLPTFALYTRGKWGVCYKPASLLALAVVLAMTGGELVGIGQRGE